jgi:hypothetical protein
MGDRPLRSKWPVILFIMVLWGVLTAHAGDKGNSGSFYIGKMNAHIKWGMNTGVTKDSVFSIQIDNLEPVEITTEKDAHIKNLEPVQGISLRSRWMVYCASPSGSISRSFSVTGCGCISSRCMERGY